MFKHFIWRLLSNAMAIGTILVQRGIITDSQCRRCCKEEESMLHLLFNCEHAQAIWRGVKHPNLEIIDPNTSFETKFRVIIDSNSNMRLSPLQRQLPLWILWRIWKSQYELLYQKKGNLWQHDLKQAIREA